MQKLSRRERQILDALYERGRATAAQIRESLPDPPGYSATRALLRILEEKGHVRHQADGPRYVFSPRVSKLQARRSALHPLVRTFFDNSASAAVTALLDDSSAKLTDQEISRIEALIERARKGGKT